MTTRIQLIARAVLAAAALTFITGAKSDLPASGLETNGIGARGRAMGNAMTAAADDWTAAFYNPAGLAWMDTDQAGIVYEYFTGGLESTASLQNLPSP